MSLQSVNKTTGELAPIAGRGSGSGILPHLIINGQPNKTMTVTKGTLVITATETSTCIYECDISEFGTYTISDGTNSKLIDITEIKIYETGLGVGEIDLTYANEFRGLSLSCSSGGTTITKTAPATGNTMAFYPPSTGTWTITGVYSGVTYSSGSITVSSLSTAVSATLQTDVEVTVTIYGAVEDTITFTDAAGVSHTVVFATGQSSKSESFKIQPNGSSITFTSSVAKNPSNLSQNYSKTVTVTNATTSIKVMPNKVIYWYGYKISNTENGLFYSGGQYGYTNLGEYTFNTRNITYGSVGAAQSRMSIFSDGINIQGKSNIKAIINGNNQVESTTFTTANAIKYPFVCTALSSDGSKRWCLFGLLTNKTDYAYDQAYVSKDVSYTSIDVLWLE